MKILLTAIATALFLCASMSSADIYFVAGSVDETLITGPESSVWHLDETSGTYKKIYSSEDPLRGFNKFEFWPDKNALVGWVLSYKGQGQLLWLPLSNPSNFKYIDLPYRPIFMGYLWKDKNKIVTFGYEDYPYVLHNLNSDEKQTINDGCDVPLDDLYLSGDSYQTDERSALGVDLTETGDVFYKFGLKKCPSKYSLDNETSKFIPNTKPNLSGISINTKHILVLGSAGEGGFKNRSCFFIFDKQRKSWKTFCAKAYALPIVRKQWIMFQLVTVEDGRVVQDKEGKFQFYNFKTQQSFDLTLGSDSEVLDIDDNGWMLYRVGDTLYKAQIQIDHISNPAKMITDDLVKNTHWGIWDKK